jgi:hydroxymethylglutaryl-CoA reductase (NADPH)
MTAPAAQRRRVPRLEDDYSRAAATRRTDFLREATGARLEHTGRCSIDPGAAAGNIENFVGAAQVPIGIVGPLLVDGEHARGEFYVPLATTEGTRLPGTARLRLLRRRPGAQVRRDRRRDRVVRGDLAGLGGRRGRMGGGARAARP